MCQSRYENRFIIKYADDSVIVSLLKEGETSYGPVTDDFVTWCEESYLQLNISKTKDMVIDFSKQQNGHGVTFIKGQKIEQMQSYKYLGTIINEKLNLDENCKSVCKKGHRHLFCLRKLAHFQIDQKFVTLFYRSVIESVLSFCLVAWFGQNFVTEKNSLNQIVRWSSRMTGESQSRLASLYSKQVQRMSLSILKNGSHPLRSEFQLLSLGRRFLV
ncbi:unnamed protein product [Oreochromis niloticus]|nr:unnamed protein product [Mustela putorius furo]